LDTEQRQTKQKTQHKTKKMNNKDPTKVHMTFWLDLIF